MTFTPGGLFEGFSLCCRHDVFLAQRLGDGLDVGEVECLLKFLVELLVECGRRCAGGFTRELAAAGGGVFADDEIFLGIDVGHCLHRFFFHLCAVGLGGKHGVDKLWLASQALQGEFAGQLLALFLGESCARAALEPLDDGLIDERDGDRKSGRIKYIPYS